MTDRTALVGRRLPAVVLDATDGGRVDLGADDGVRRILFVYPRTGDPTAPDSPAWAAIPGAKGCTAEACSFRDLRDDFARLGWDVAGCSVQSTTYQAEAVARLHLPYPLLSDRGLELRDALGLDTFAFEGTTLYRRVTLLIDGGRVAEVIVADDDPSGHVEDVLRVVERLG